MNEQTLLRMGSTDFTGLRGWNPQAPQLSVEEHRRMREREKGLRVEPFLWRGKGGSGEDLASPGQGRRETRLLYLLAGGAQLSLEPVLFG